MTLINRLPTPVKRILVKGKINGLNQSRAFTPGLMSPNRWSPTSSHSRFTDAVVEGDFDNAQAVLNEAGITISPRQLRRNFRRYWA